MEFVDFMWIKLGVMCALALVYGIYLGVTGR